MKIAVMGYGTIGSGVVDVLRINKEKITKRAGEPVDVKYILDLREFPGDPMEDAIVHDYQTIVNDPEIGIVVETMGGVEPAYTFVKAMLEAGKQVATSNKNLVAAKGAELIKIARDHNVNFQFEASVGGGIPIIRPLNKCLTADEIEEITGILNGTTNYMLTKMSAEHLDFNDVLREAQEKGYAESDPTADIGGLDAARKIAILASIAFNTRVSLDDVYIEGIESLTLRDIDYAKELGYVVKLLAIAKRDEVNGISVRVHPTMLPNHHPLANVNDVYNAIFVTGDAVGDTMFLGRGAGRMPTASAVCGDIIDVSRNIRHNATGRISCTCFDEKHLCTIENITSPCYIRLLVHDKPGVLAGIAAAFGAQSVSLKNVVQKAKVDGFSELVVITYDVSEFNLRMALQTLRALPIVEKICSVIRVEDDNLD